MIQISGFMQLQHFFVSLFCMVFLLAGLAHGQSQVEDVVYLKSGSILRGEIIKRIEGEAIKIKAAGNVYVVRLEKLKKVKTGKAANTSYVKKEGYTNRTGIDLLMGGGKPAVRVRMVNGYQFTPTFSAGLGAGFVLYDDPLNLIPLFVDLSYKFLQANITPFVSFKGGYSFSVLPDGNDNIESHRGGIMINPAVGIQFELNSSVGLYLNSGYSIEHASFTRMGWIGRSITTEITYRRVQFGIGLSF